MTGRGLSTERSRQARPQILRKTALQLLSGDVIEEGGRYRGIVHAVHHHGMCASVELIDGTRIALDVGRAISVRA